MITDDIVTGEHNKTYIVPVSEIVSYWYPGDFTTPPGACECSDYHSCKLNEFQWEDVFEVIWSGKRYDVIHESVKNNGFTGQLRARVTEDDHVILLDGHHRLGVLLDLSVREVPVYVGSKDSVTMDLVAPDSGWWNGTSDPWTIIMG